MTKSKLEMMVDYGVVELVCKRLEISYNDKENNFNSKLNSNEKFIRSREVYINNNKVYLVYSRSRTLLDIDIIH